jgi:DNA-binding NarL/FixJ family response regulator
MTTTRVLLADDHALFREGLSGILDAQPDFEIVGQAGDGLEAVAKARALKPDLILMDIKMPSCDGLEATRLIKSARPDVKIVVLTVHEEDEKLFEAVRSGAVGYILKNTLPEEFLRLVRGVTEGKAAISPAMAARILAEFSRLPPPPNTSDSYQPLTRREKEVLTLAAGGATDQEIADALTLSLHTVKSHMRHILAKLHAANRREAAEVAAQEGLFKR